jgi:heat-inducible transcriptional repressor
MSDLEQLGLVYAPHTSAGRLPTEIGLRFFVDALMQVGDLSESERRAIDAHVMATGNSIDNLLTQASGLLSGLTRAAGVVLTAKVDVRLKHIEFVRLEPERALVVLVAEDGQVENRILSVPAGLPTSALTEASNFLNARIRGKTLMDSRAELERALEAGQAELDQLTQKIVAAGLAIWSGGGRDERKLIVRGQSHLLDDLKALEDLERVRLLFDDLETRREVVDLLGRAERAGAHLHRLGEQAVLAVGFLHHRGALYRRSRSHRGRARGDRADSAQLCSCDPNGRLHRQGGEQAAGRIVACVNSLIFHT